MMMKIVVRRFCGKSIRNVATSVKIVCPTCVKHSSKLVIRVETHLLQPVAAALLLILSHTHTHMYNTQQIRTFIRRDDGEWHRLVCYYYTLRYTFSATKLK